MLVEPVQIKVLILGPPGSGKSSLMHKVTSDSFVESNRSYHGVDTRMKKVQIESKLYAIRFWDITSCESFEDSSNLVMREASIALIVADSSSKEHIQEMVSLNSKVKKKSQEVLPYSLPTILCLTKSEKCQETDFNCDQSLKNLIYANE